MIEEKLYSAFGATNLTQGLVLLIEIKKKKKKKKKDYCGLFKSHLQGVPIVWKP